MNSMELPEREKSAPQPEEPVNSIEDDGAITEDQWQGMGDMLMAIYDFREQE
jgi:chromatin structure-remodeling complex subunit RSC1/2